MIEFNKVSYSYDKNSGNAVDELSMSIEQNEWIALIGHNGSGKSTLAKLMNGLLLPTSGTISVDGLSLSEDTYWEIRKKVGMVFQNPENQFVGTTVMDDVAFGLENLGVPREEMVKRVSAALKEVDMYSFKDQAPNRLSGGQKQRVAIAGILAIMPEVIIFDEASTMLDPNGKQELLETIKGLRKTKKMTIVYITHDLSEAAYADRIIVMNEGRQWMSGKPREVFQYQNELSEIGLEIPLISSIYAGMNEHGVKLEKEPLHMKELVDQLWKLSSKM
ncbi:energy-coupling factor ABC transporter ATP-binding protein [Allobacillus sp. GCM10007491]|uniref:Energy-coupling factor ABC transporter ATP-binding protein n=1 Tax=Allobacillus saliphilus TaxID=2912308 RepID=A0A941HU18_9BACI|nr:MULTISPECIES: energy-coupling factor ABC transporter ATP-binding protein [Allobacillus]MBR7553869.1 energy-coupling factor ABC transporter ATP-binding protein [Allobacillus saliphilus]TSJ63614.1 energy-coupling factor ABC transporter ATP-binding protein [Allobacillus sp. SKP2-8]